MDFLVKIHRLFKVKVILTVFGIVRDKLTLDCFDDLLERNLDLV